MTLQSALNIVAVKFAPRAGTTVTGRLLPDPSGGAGVPVWAAASPGSEVRIYAQQTDEPTLLWQGEGHAGAHAPDLVAFGSDGLLCLAPGKALMRIALHDGVVRAEEMKISKGPPLRIFAVADAVHGLFETGKGVASIARLRPRSSGVAAQRFQSLPHMNAHCRTSGLARDARGRMVLTANNEVTGFQLWRQDEAGGWVHLITDGAARYGFNAAVHDLTAWGDMVALAAGSGRLVQERMFGLRMKSEILVLADDGDYHILCGEARTSASGLQVPLAGVANAAARDVGTGIRLAVDGDRLIAAMQSDETAARIYHVAPNFKISAPDDVEGVVGGFDVRAKDEGKVSVVVFKQ